MKKLLVLLFSILISFNSYGETVKMTCTFDRLVPFGEGEYVWRFDGKKIYLNGQKTQIDGAVHDYGKLIKVEKLSDQEFFVSLYYPYVNGYGSPVEMEGLTWSLNYEMEVIFNKRNSTLFFGDYIDDVDCY